MLRISLLAVLIYSCYLTPILAELANRVICISQKPRLRKTSRADCITAIDLIVTTDKSLIKNPAAFRHGGCIALIQRVWLTDGNLGWTVEPPPKRNPQRLDITFPPDLFSDVVVGAGRVLKQCYDPAKAEVDRKLGLTAALYDGREKVFNFMIGLTTTPKEMPRNAEKWLLKVDKYETLFNIYGGSRHSTPGPSAAGPSSPERPPSPELPPAPKIVVPPSRGSSLLNNYSSSERSPLPSGGSSSLERPASPDIERPPPLSTGPPSLFWPPNHTSLALSQGLAPTSVDRHARNDGASSSGRYRKRSSGLLIVSKKRSTGKRQLGSFSQNNRAPYRRGNERRRIAPSS